MTTWIVLRAAGIGAYVMLFLSVVWGLVGTTILFGKLISRNSATLVHQFMATTGLVLLGVHLGGLLVDPFMKFALADVIVPMASTYKPGAVTVGVVAMYATVFLIVTSWLRKPMGTKWWKRTHLLAVPTFTLSMLHGIFAGTDTVRPVMWWMYVATGGIVLCLVVVRALTFEWRPERASRPAHARSERQRAPEPVGP